MFADDAYNKFSKGGHGTLCGNWLEERAIRDATGEGRTIPQRHIRRSGLLKDFSKMPSSGPRKSDNTFERMYGAKMVCNATPWSKVLGSETEPALKKAPRELLAGAARLQLAEQEVQEEEEERDRRACERQLRTTSEIYFAKPDETLIEKPTHCRASFKEELLHGPAPERSRALRNAGLNVQTNVHYSNVEGPTHQLMCMQDKRLRNDIKASACAGFSTFGKQADFSKPVQQFVLGLNKDDALDSLFQSLSGPRRPQGAAPQAVAFQGVPSLTVLKEAVREGLRDKGGYVQLRQRLHDLSDHEGFVSAEDSVQLLCEALPAEALEVALPAVQVYVRQHLTMRKDAVRVSALVASLRPSLAQEHMSAVLAAFKELGAGESFPLYTWLSKLRDLELRRSLVTAFGGDPSDESSVSELPVTQHTFTDLISDLAPFVPMEELLA